MLQAGDRRWWRRVFCAYAPLSLSTMAGMGIGAGAFMLTSIWVMARSWKKGGKQQLKRVFTHPSSWASLAVLVVSFLSLLFAWIFPPLGEAVSGFAELKKFHYFLYPPLVALAFLFTSDEIERHPFWKFWGGMGIFCALLAVVQFFGANLFPAEWLQHRFFRPVGGTDRFHGQGLMFFHLSFASCMCFVASAGLARVLWPLRWDDKKDRIFWGLVTACGFLAVFLSFSRIALAALVVVGAFLFFLKKPLWGALALALLLGVSAVIWRESPSLQARFELNGGGNTERVLMWKSAWAMFEDRPVLGFGFGRSGRYTPYYAEKILGSAPWFSSHAHDNMLDALAATGVLGLLAYLAWWVVLFVSAWRSFRAATDKWLPAAALGAFVAFQVNGLTQVNFWDGKSQHSLMIWAGVVVALAMRRKSKEQRL